MTFFITDLHKDLRQARLARRGASPTGEGIVEGVHKTYPRMEAVSLPAPAALGVSLDEVLTKRMSATRCISSEAFSLEDLGTLLGAALGRHSGQIKRKYPSGGALYPVETYLLLPQSDELKAGVYHYNPTDHALERLWDIPYEVDVMRLVNGPEEFTMSGLLIFTNVWPRSSAKYGDFAYVLGLLEAGHMSENILLVGTALGFPMRPIEGYADKALNELLDLDTEKEQVVQTIMLGKSQTE
ncbi:SagB/ThcOx family dehydrogenase [Patescibacteria group bacterium]|nr:SagB/ThcOx family dehydrogenase [Patescibacteria group bacterium]